jgi:hypothetical protein
MVPNSKINAGFDSKINNLKLEIMLNDSVCHLKQIVVDLMLTVN